MKWESPWGIGFPGWHIECSAMASKYLGDRIDIHCGGIDHIGVHHTNEIAQSECCFGHTWVNYWLHGEFLLTDKQKMSKSIGETLTVDTLTKHGFGPLDYRYLLLTAHYRSKMTFTYQALEAAKNALQNLRIRLRELKKEASIEPSTLQLPPEENQEAQHAYSRSKKDFWKAIYNDLHTPTALSVAWEVIKRPILPADQKLQLFEEFDQVLGLDLVKENVGKLVLTDAQKELIRQREIARDCKDWETADRIRSILLSQGIQLKDNDNGTTSWISIQ